MIVVVNKLFMDIQETRIEVGLGTLNEDGDVEVDTWLFDINHNNVVEFAGSSSHDGIEVTEGRTI